MKTVLSLVILSFSLSAFAELPDFCKPGVEEVARDFKQYKELNCDEGEGMDSDILFIQHMKRTYVENLGRQCEMEVLTGGRRFRNEMHLSTDIHSVDFAEEAGKYYDSLISKQD